MNDFTSWLDAQRLQVAVFTVDPRPAGIQLITSVARRWAAFEFGRQPAKLHPAMAAYMYMHGFGDSGIVPTEQLPCPRCATTSLRCRGLPPWLNWKMSDFWPGIDTSPHQLTVAAFQAALAIELDRLRVSVLSSLLRARARASCGVSRRNLNELRARNTPGFEDSLRSPGWDSFAALRRSETQMKKHARDLRSRQLNPGDANYWGSRGLPVPAPPASPRALAPPNTTDPAPKPEKP